MTCKVISLGYNNYAISLLVIARLIGGDVKGIGTKRVTARLHELKIQ